jgi:hypothetical protein
MIAAAEARGYEYYAVTDHAPNLVMQRMTDEKTLAQRAELRALAHTTGTALLHGTELKVGCLWQDTTTLLRCAQLTSLSASTQLAPIMKSPTLTPISESEA